METYSKSQFRARALNIMRYAQASGQPVQITENGKVVLELRPVTEVSVADTSALLCGSVLRYDDPLAPVIMTLWDADQ
ncbi:MAG: type II toxin-antitoxin system Phd/YefM family antitoxin [Gammaproteobacteria bacterium]|nr:type II toxin-antitoxin system Phd/YefM family antitoxin [Gammaproteobacteria bacterium]